tara:strand:- start:10290 stop:12152 length:1863 start_codon:yes stop_codon:yes gene_type:complete
MHRSGTSAITGALEKMGVMLPQELMPATGDNQKGYFEGVRVMQINDAFLSDMQSNWDDTRFSLAITEKLIEKHLPEVIKFIEEEFLYCKLFALKDPRMCITFPLWERALKEAEIEIKIILPYRNPLEIARSLKQRNDFSVEKSLLLWAKYVLHAERVSRPYSRYFIDFSEVLNNTIKELTKVADFIDLKPDSTAIKEVQESFLEKNLKHHNLDTKNIADNLPQFMQMLISFVQKSSFSTVTAQEFDRICNDFAAIDQFMHTRDVQFESQLARDLHARWNEERALVNALEAIKDPSFVDEAYYLDRYPDVGQSETNPTYHYMEFGKQEGRYPNRYCEQYHLKVKEISSPSEKLYWTHKKLSEKESELDDRQQQFSELQAAQLELEQHYSKEEATSQTRITELEAEKAALCKSQDTLNQELESLLVDLQSVKESKQRQKVELESQLNEMEATSQTRITELEAEKAALCESQDTLNQELESLLGDLQSVKESKQRQKVELESRLNEMQATCQTRIIELEAEKAALCESQDTLNQELESLLGDLQSVKDAKQSQKVELESQLNDLQASSQTRIAELEQEILLLTQSIDQVVSDLACIKESKCWVYTKPIRHLSMAFKHENREVK